MSIDKFNSLKNFRYFLFFLFASLFIYVLDTHNYLSFFHQVADFLAVPVKKQLYQAPQKLRSQNSIKTKEKELKSLTNQLTAAREKIKQLEEENKALRTQLETPLSPQWEYQDAKVIGLSQDLTIDKGRNSNLKEGQIVLSENIFVGRIKSVSFSQSQVQLPINSQLIIPVMTSKTKARGILKGEFGTKIVLTNVLQEDKLEIGDLVLTTGEAQFPKGLLIGKIKKIIKKETEIYQKAEVEPLLNYKELETVFVLVKE